MKFLHSEKTPKIHSNRQNRLRYSLFRVLTSSYQSVNINVTLPGFPETFDRFWRLGKGSADWVVAPLPGSTATSIRVAEYLTELPPREVLEQKLKVAVAMHKEQLAARTVGK